MTRLETHSTDVLEDEPTNRATKRQPIEKVGTGVGGFTVAEFDDAHESLHEVGVIRIHDPSVPAHDVDGQSPGGGPEVGPYA